MCCEAYFLCYSPSCSYSKSQFAVLFSLDRRVFSVPVFAGRMRTLLDWFLGSDILSELTIIMNQTRELF